MENPEYIKMAAELQKFNKAGYKERAMGGHSNTLKDTDVSCQITINHKNSPFYYFISMLQTQWLLAVS